MSDVLPQSAAVDGSGEADARLAEHMHGELLSAKHELESLERLLSNAVAQLFGSFGRAHEIASQAGGGVPGALAEELRAALTALQFEDMASQLIVHSRHRVASVADCLENASAGGERHEVRWVERACPVAQRAVDAGSVELF